jgi:hypothetical protein
MAHKFRLGNLLRPAASAAAGVGASRARRFLRHAGRTEHTCSCGLKTMSEFRWNTHKCTEPVGRWASAQAKKIARGMGKAQDEARRHARRVREYMGVAETRKVPIRGKDGKEIRGKDGRPKTRDASVQTPKGRSRPEGTERGVLSRGTLRSMDRHHRHINPDGTPKRHVKAARLIDDDRGGRLTRRIRGTGPVRNARHRLAARHIRKGDEHRAEHPVRPVTPRPAPAAPPNGNGRATTVRDYNADRGTRPAPNGTRPARTRTP